MEEESQNRIATQNFDLNIAMCVVFIILSYVNVFLGIEYKAIGHLNSILIIILMWSFKKYLQNFDAPKAMYWLKWNIINWIALVVCGFVLNYVSWLEDDSSIIITQIKMAMQTKGRGY